MIRFFTLLVVLSFTGCASSEFNAKEVHRTLTVPLVFTDTVDALGITKVVNADGTITYKAADLTHTTAVGGVTRTSVYKEAEIKVKEDK